MPGSVTQEWDRVTSGLVGGELIDASVPGVDRLEDVIPVQVDLLGPVNGHVERDPIVLLDGDGVGGHGVGADGQIERAVLTATAHVPESDEPGPDDYGRNDHDND